GALVRVRAAVQARGSGARSLHAVAVRPPPRRAALAGGAGRFPARAVGDPRDGRFATRKPRRDGPLRARPFRRKAAALRARRALPLALLQRERAAVLATRIHRGIRAAVLHGGSGAVRVPVPSRLAARRKGATITVDWRQAGSDSKRRATPSAWDRVR